MRTRLSVLAIAISALSTLTACNGDGGSSSFDVDTTVNLPVPTVTVSAPETAVAGFAFDVEWASADATGCEADFTDSTATSGVSSETEMTAGEVTYTVTCSGAGGSASGSATVLVNAAPIAEGLWQGTTDDDRAIAGVVTHPDVSTQVSQFFLAYSQAGNHAVAAGFVAGGGASTATTPTGGDFASGAATDALREFNFEGDGAAAGNLIATYTGQTAFNGSFTSTSLAATWAFDGQMAGSSFTIPDSLAGLITASSFTPDPITFSDGGTPWSIDTATPAFSGAVVFDPYVEHLAVMGLDVDITFTARTLTFAGSVDGHPSTVTYNAGTRTLTWTGYYTETKTATCTGDEDLGGAVCATFASPSTPTAGSVTLTFDDDSLTTYQGTVIWLTGSNPTEGNAPMATMSFTGSVPSTPSVTKTYASTYNADYELTPDIATIAGSYTSGQTGIDATMHNTASLTVASDGSITGNASNCNYEGTLAVHAIGNVYDITVTFSDGGAACVYTSSGAFTGIATYDAETETLTITAVNADRDQGFMVVGSKAAPL